MSVSFVDLLPLFKSNLFTNAFMDKVISGSDKAEIRLPGTHFFFRMDKGTFPSSKNQKKKKKKKRMRPSCQILLVVFWIIIYLLYCSGRSIVSFPWRVLSIWFCISQRWWNWQICKLGVKNPCIRFAFLFFFLLFCSIILMNDLNSASV